MAAARWSRPRDGDGAATRYLFVGNAGPACGIPGERLEEVLRPLGGLVRIENPSGSGSRTRTTNKAAGSHLFAVFEAEEDARRVKEAIGGVPCDELGGRRLVMEYAQYHPPKSHHAKVAHYGSENAAADAAELNIDGLHLYKEFITEDEEKQLLADIEANGEWHHLARRRVKHFGYEFDYSIRGVNREKRMGELPAFTSGVTSKFKSLNGLAASSQSAFDQLTVNEYPSGIGLSPHVDTHSAFEDAILSLSLGSSSVMEFRRHGDDDHRRLFLPPRSLMVMEGEARYAWQHYIPHRKSDRIAADAGAGAGEGEGSVSLRRGKRTSMTFRTIRVSGQCSCSYPQCCDSQEGKLPPTRMKAKSNDEGQASVSPATGSASSCCGVDETVSPELEKLHVRKVYDSIAGHFSATRFAIWPEVKTFLDSMKRHSLVADLGCGNGKYFDVGKHCCMTGGDLSHQLVAMCKQRGYEVVQLDVVKPPYRKGIFDGAISIAVLHHMSSFNRRLTAMRRIVDLLRPGGRALVTVWAMEQEEEKKMKKWVELDDNQSNKGDLGRDFLVPWNVPFHRPEASKAAKSTEEAAGKIDEKKGTVVFQRFYHVFEKGELDHLVGCIPNVTVVKSLYDRSNWCIVVQKDEEDSN